MAFPRMHEALGAGCETSPASAHDGAEQRPIRGCCLIVPAAFQPRSARGPVGWPPTGPWLVARRVSALWASASLVKTPTTSLGPEEGSPCALVPLRISTSWPEGYRTSS